jgi:hypothetical protein
LKRGKNRHILYSRRIFKGGLIMKKVMILALLVVAFGFAGYSCESIGGMSDTTKGAAVGAGVGAIAGQIIGGNTAGTLIGAAVGTLGGAIVGHEMDYQKQKSQQQRAVAAPDAYQEAPPGQWVQVPGQWVNGKWVPAHKAWVPVNP